MVDLTTCVRTARIKMVDHVLVQEPRTLKPAKLAVMEELPISVQWEPSNPVLPVLVLTLPIPRRVQHAKTVEALTVVPVEPMFLGLAVPEQDFQTPKHVQRVIMMCPASTLVPMVHTGPEVPARVQAQPILRLAKFVGTVERLMCVG